jgi:hypothetical protein
VFADTQGLADTHVFAAPTQALSMKAPGFAAAMAAASAYEEVAVNCGPNVQVRYAVGYDSAPRPGADNGAAQ